MFCCFWLERVAIIIRTTNRWRKWLLLGLFLFLHCLLVPQHFQYFLLLEIHLP
uniref:Uncharacterized protein n=1 Tax=Lotus japonicus TaxID=34305 RepID=I3SMC7_LOTJA|nr:unknown [Lotus japonicus]